MLSRLRACIFGIGIILSLLVGTYFLVSLWPRNFSVMNLKGSLSDAERIPMREGEWTMVSRVTDGDTIEIETGEKVRYIGINTPESVDPRRKVECFGKEASAYNKNLVEGKRVRLERDISDRDKYGRLLRFVYLEDGTLVNGMLVREGYAHASPYTPDISRKELFREAESDARMNARGLWSPDACDGKK